MIFARRQTFLARSLSFTLSFPVVIFSEKGTFYVNVYVGFYAAEEIKRCAIAVFVHKIKTIERAACLPNNSFAFLLSRYVVGNRSRQMRCRQ